ncbi:MAG: phosphotriesterase family protein, partial [Dehalococcoidia bacterium]
MATIQSVTGPVETADLGMTLMHEHIVTISPGVYANWPDAWDRQAVFDGAVHKLRDVKARGIGTLVDLTTVDLGRDVAFVHEIAAAAQMTIIVA